MRNVPKLRFKEFTDEWEEKKLGEIGKVSMCKRIMKDQTSVSGDIPFYKIGTFGKKADSYISKEIYKEYKNKYSFPNKGDILLSASGTIGRTVIYNGEPSYFQDSNIVWIANNEKNVLNSFLFQLYKNIKWTTENTTIARLYNDNLSNMCVYFPILKEQEKIADFLSNVDKKISITEEKLNLFEEYKKGIMQKIFNQELRFKDENGNHYPEWEEKRLGDLITSQGGKALEKYSNESGKYKFISIGNYSENSKFFDNGRRIDLNSETKKQLLNKDELVMILNDKTKTGNIIGRTLLIEEDDMYIYNQRSQRIICNKEFLPNFAYVLLNSSYRNNIIQNAQGGTQIYINFSTVENFIVNLPCLEEQKKIADFLLAIDTKIGKLSDELENLKEFKKGLLQQMFV